MYPVWFLESEITSKLLISQGSPGELAAGWQLFLTGHTRATLNGEEAVRLIIQKDQDQGRARERS